MRTIKFEKMGLQTLFDYVASAHGNRRTIPGFHLKQFLNIARGGKSDAAAGIPDTCLVSPQSVPGISKDFEKVAEMLQAAREEKRGVVIIRPNKTRGIGGSE
ncbi:MAG: hypothetical protein AAB805_00985 [Patescibacteria group bacterium]